MSAEEKILQGIIDDAKVQADTIMAQAQTKCEQILASGKAEAKEYAAKTVSDALRGAKAIKLNAESSAELVVRDAKLAKKHEEIEKTLSLAVEKIVSLPDNKYFALLLGLVKANALAEQGVLKLSPADLLRDISVLEKQFGEWELNITIDKTPADIKHGFILKYGDIEYDLSLEAVISDKKDALEDKVNGILFAD